MAGRHWGIVIDISLFLSLAGLLQWLTFMTQVCLYGWKAYDYLSLVMTPDYSFWQAYCSGLLCVCFFGWQAKVSSLDNSFSLWQAYCSVIRQGMVLRLVGIGLAVTLYYSFSFWQAYCSLIQQGIVLRLVGIGLAVTLDYLFLCLAGLLQCYTTGYGSTSGRSDIFPVHLPNHVASVLIICYCYVTSILVICFNYVAAILDILVCYGSAFLIICFYYVSPFLAIFQCFVCLSMRRV